MNHILLDITSPLDDVIPTLGPLKNALGPLVGNLLAIVWFLAIVVAIIWFALALAAIGAAKTDKDPDALGRAMSRAALPVGSLALLAILPVIVDALL